MEIWYNLATMELKAVYSDTYSGTVWADAGYISFVNDDRRVPGGFTPGAIIDLTGRDPVVVTPAPARTPDPREVRIGELRVKLANDTITDAELREYLRLREGL